MTLQDPASDASSSDDKGTQHIQGRSDTVSQRRPSSRFEPDEEITEGFVLPPGSEKRGAKLFKKHCAQCHSVFPDGRHLIAGNTSWGPTLWNVYMRTAGVERSTSANPISPNMSGIVWDDAHLMRYMKNPRLFVDGPISMNFFGIPDFQDRVDIVHYLRTLTGSHRNGQKILSIGSSTRISSNTTKEED